MDSLEQQGAPASLKEFVLPSPLPEGTEGKLWLLPAGPAPAADYWKQLTRLVRMTPLLGAEGAGLAALLDLKARIEDQFAPDYLLLDARTGITEVGGVATSVLADKVVCLLVENRESLDGTRAVLRSLRRQERPLGHRPIEVFPVLSRVTGDVDEARQDALARLNEGIRPPDAMEELFVIRDDPSVETDGGGQTVPGPPEGAQRDYRYLLATLVPVGPGSVSRAWARHEAVQDLIDWLAGTGDRDHYRRPEPSTFSHKWVDEGIRLGGPEGRYADLVAFADDDHAEPLLAAEYAGDELTTSTAWAWWQANTDLRCVILFNQTGRRVFTRGRPDVEAGNGDRVGARRRRRPTPFVDRGDQWGVRWPASFRALDDPGDHSVPSLIAAVRRGEHVFVPFLVERWQHATWFGLHGGFQPNLRLAKEILDGLASVTGDGEWAVLYHTAPDDMEPRHGRWSGDESMFEEHTEWGLHAPLWWRLSARSKIGHGGRGHFRSRATPTGVQLLASEVMGLSFDQDRQFRDLATRLGSDRRRLHHAFAELEFAITDEAPPELVRRAALNPEDEPKFPNEINSIGQAREQAKADFVARPSLDRLLRDPSGRVSVVTTNLLGGYDAASCRVVLYQPIAAWCAEAIGADQRALENVVLLHETVHALCHLGLDLDGNRWDEFGLPPSTYPAFQPSALHEGLAQYFTFRMLERLDDPSMMDAFERLSAVQPPEYQTWLQMRALPLERARTALLQARAGSASILSDLVGHRTAVDEQHLQ